MLKIPYNQEIENSVIGALLSLEDGPLKYSDCLVSGVTARTFYIQKNCILFQSVGRVISESGKNDIPLIIADLERNKVLDDVGGVLGVSDAMSAFTGIAFSDWVHNLRELETRRSLVLECTKGVEMAGDVSVDLDSAITFLDRAITSSGVSLNGDKTKTVPDVVRENKDSIDLLLSGKPQPQGLSTGFYDWDSMTNGLQPRTLNVIAARPSVGKTSLAMNIVENIIQKKIDKRILFFSLEMDSRSILEKLIATTSGVSLGRVRDGFVNSEQVGFIGKAKEFWDGTNLLINDSSDLNANQIRAIARQKNNRHKLDLIIVDYLQFITPVDFRGSREQQVSDCSRNLKAMAKELDCPVVVLSQLSRDSEKGERRPRLSDLRDSGAIEQDADTVSFLWPNHEKQVVEMIISKNRYGSTGTVNLVFNAPITKFTSATV